MKDISDVRQGQWISNLVPPKCEVDLTTCDLCMKGGVWNKVSPAQKLFNFHKNDSGEHILFPKSSIDPLWTRRSKNTANNCRIRKFTFSYVRVSLVRTYLLLLSSYRPLSLFYDDFIRTKTELLPILSTNLPEGELVSFVAKPFKGSFKTRQYLFQIKWLSRISWRTMHLWLDSLNSAD